MNIFYFFSQNIAKNILLFQKFDKQADALASLIAQQTKKNFQAPMKGINRPEQPYGMNVQLSMKGEDNSAENEYNSEEDQLAMESSESDENADEESSNQSGEHSNFSRKIKLEPARLQTLIAITY